MHLGRKETTHFPTAMNAVWDELRECVESGFCGQVFNLSEVPKRLGAFLR